MEEASEENGNDDHRFDYDDHDDQGSGDPQPADPALEENSTNLDSEKRRTKESSFLMQPLHRPLLPTDLGLLNEAHEKLEHIIDVLYEQHKGKLQKPRTYR